ncbi:MAG: HAD-IA family hydrolase [bacterium]|nr:HAD-IA family hydrolase [bacterium]
MNRNIKAVVFDYFGVIELFEGSINSELVSYFPKLKALGLKTGIFSNANSLLRTRLNEFGLEDLPDALVLSGEIGYQKPHKEAFRVLFEKLELRPEEVVFIDDSAENLAKANEIGYVPILFKDNEQVKGELQKLGIVL